MLEARATFVDNIFGHAAEVRVVMGSKRRRRRRGGRLAWRSREYRRGWQCVAHRHRMRRGGACCRGRKPHACCCSICWKNGFCGAYCCWYPRPPAPKPPGPAPNTPRKCTIHNPRPTQCERTPTMGRFSSKPAGQGVHERAYAFGVVYFLKTRRRRRGRQNEKGCESLNFPNQSIDARDRTRRRRNLLVFSNATASPPRFLKK
jgi:hypothetical protein